MSADMTTIVVAILIALPIALIIGAGAKKANGKDDGQPWEHESIKARWD